MGNIVVLTPGDLVDRQTILQIKLSKLGADSNNGTQADEVIEMNSQRAISRSVLTHKGVDIQPLLLEHEAIQQKLELDWFPKLAPDNEGVFDGLMETLKNVNQELWKFEDQARILRHAPDKFLETVLRRKADVLDGITMNNDIRIGTVAQINALWNLQSEVKVYS